MNETATSRTGGTGSSFAAGYLWTFGSTALPLLSAFLVSLITARLLGPRIVGLINWTMATATVLLIVGKYGVDGASSRLLSEYQVTAPGRLGRVVRLGILMRLLFTVPTAVAALLFAPQLAAFFKEPALVPLFRLMSLLIVAVSLNELLDLMILGLSRFRLLFSVRCAMLVARVAFVYAAALGGLGAGGVLGGFTLGTFVPSVLSLVVLLGMRSPAAQREDAEPVWRRLFLLATPLAVSGASVTIYTIQDKLMIGYYHNAYEVGLYSMARSLAETLLFPTFALTMVLRPGLAGAWACRDRDRCARLVNRSIRLCLLYGAAVVVVFSCIARPFVTGLFTDTFEPSAALLLLFLPLIVIRCIGVVVLPGLIAADRAGTYAKLTLAGAAINFVLNALLIPPLRSTGAIIATVISYVPIEILGLRALWKAFPPFWGRSDTAAALLTGGAAAAIVAAHRLLLPEPGSFVAAIAHGAALTAAFAAAVLALRVITLSEVRGLLRAVASARGSRARRGEPLP